MSFDSLLNTTCTVQVKTNTQDSLGQMVESWANLLTSVPCRIDPAGGQKTVASTQVYEKATHVLFMRKNSTYTLTSKDHRIVLGGKNYDVLAVREFIGLHDAHHLELLLEYIL